ncbi:glycosyltransferase family 2 protein [Panacibacter ginsenosidivorans]|uniref:Glycosyltransferase family 2 protein n=1 Tax=Panacibacter ginsenosidivorans TaxID=1813871 RepID=A0A5B8VFF4_9BACT|nr:glycosyltransferase family 2 protein [Panacibacter ginsenosidivorans]QEC69078.1 glycosyltransferase family 2 protein [Panacibacter ginsenosidivorans]
MPAYNAAASVASGIKSLQEQTYSNWELIIVDDGSTDDTAAIIQSIAHTDKRIKYFYQQNSKQGKARNKGIKEAAGAFIAFIDADDVWMHNKLEKQIEFINLTNADLVFADVTAIDEKGDPYLDSWNVTDATYSGDEGLLAFMQENKAPLLSVLVKKEAVLKVNGFDEDRDMQYVEDYDLWLRMLQSGARFASSSEKLACYSFDTKKTTARKKTLINVVNTLKKVSVHDESLQQQKNLAMTLWTRKIIKRCTPAIEKADMKKIISLIPSPPVKFFLSIINNILGASVAGRIILLFTKNVSVQG